MPRIDPASTGTYRVSVTTPLGALRRVLRAQDPDDALEQVLVYCFGEGLAVDLESLAVCRLTTA